MFLVSLTHARVIALYFVAVSLRNLRTVALEPKNTGCSNRRDRSGRFSTVWAEERIRNMPMHESGRVISLASGWAIRQPSMNRFIER
jgi:hypothetical protein